MGLRRALKLVDTSSGRSALTAAAPSVASEGLARVGIRSPWASTALSPIIWNDIYGVTGADLPVARGDALSIPAVTKGVTLITTTLASCPLTKYLGDVVATDQPPWAYATDGAIAPQYRTQFTVEDLIFEGWALWQVKRAADGTIETADRVRPDRWEFDDDNAIKIDGKVANAETFVLIKGPHDGILITGRRALRGALNVELAWQRWVRNPIPATLLQQIGDDELTESEIDTLLAGWRGARQDPDGAVAFVPSTVKVEALGTFLPDLLTEARNASAIDVARLLCVPAISLDAGPIQTSLTYANTETANGQTLPLYGLSPYANAIAYALSMDSVVEPGARMALDMTQLLDDAATISRTGTPTKD